MDDANMIIEIALEHYPELEAIYLFGTHGTEFERPDSDVDIGLLLPWKQARREKNLIWTPCHTALEVALGKQIDLVNVRAVSTVFQIEIIRPNRLLYCVDANAVAEFEMLALSLYQKLNEERGEILDAFHATGRAYGV